MEQPKIEYDIYIAAMPEAVWAALTSSQFTRQYWGEMIESDWNDGSRVVSMGLDGSLHWRGEVLEYESPHHLCYTFCLPDDEPWETRVRFDIEDVTPQYSPTRVTHLALAHDQFHQEDAFYEGSRIAWPKVLSSLKSLLEGGRSLGFYEQPSRAA